jgi:predicted alpha/beta hydrolase family esterase
VKDICQWEYSDKKGCDDMERSYLIIHGLNGSGEGHWQKWLFDELKRRGEKVFFPELPHKDSPNLAEWLKVIDEFVNKLTGERVVVLHSLGAVSWFHYSGIKREKAAERVLLVAPPSESVIRSIPEISSFINIPLDKKKIDNLAEKIRLVSSDGDIYCPEKASKVYGEYLGVSQDILAESEGHINIKSGYGRWESVLDWCFDEKTTIRSNKIMDKTVKK